MAIHSGWKVLSVGRWSAWMRGEGGGAIQYPVDTWVYPRAGCGPLGVFGDYDEAEAWANNWFYDKGPLTVHRCQFKFSRFRSFWRTVGGKIQKNIGGPLLTQETFQQMTVKFADAVKTLD